MNAESSADWERPTGDCPRWCCGEHVGQFHPDDAIHASCMAPVPVILRTRTVEVIGWDQADLWSQDDPVRHDTTESFGSEHNQPDSASDILGPENPRVFRASSAGYLMDEATYFDITRMQWVAGGDEWIFIGDSHASWMITLESARRIFRAMGQILSA